MRIGFDFKLVAYFLMISLTYILTLIWFVDKNRYDKHKLIHHGFFLLLIVWSVLALISQPVVLKAYALLSVFSVVVVEALITKRRKQIQ